VVSNRDAAEEACRYDQKRFRIEIVSTQMTKRGGFACRPRGHPIADFHLRIVDDDAINEECHQWSALGKRQVVEGRGQALTQRRDSLGEGGTIDVRLCLGIALSPWLRSALLTVGPLLSFPLELCPFEHLREGPIKPSSLLTFELRQDVTPRLPARWQGLGQPFAPLRARQFMGDEGRLPQHAAEVLPDQRSHGVRWGIARRAALPPGCPQRIRAPLTDRRGIARGKRPTSPRQPTLRPAAEATQ
jgi:hypothetical protein